MVWNCFPRIFAPAVTVRAPDLLGCRAGRTTMVRQAPASVDQTHTIQRAVNGPAAPIRIGTTHSVEHLPVDSTEIVDLGLARHSRPIGGSARMVPSIQ